MSRALAHALAELARSSQAAAVVAWKDPQGHQGAEVLLSHPAGLLQPGTPWPAGPASDGSTIVCEPAALAALVSTSLRLALPDPPRAAWNGSLAGGRYVLLIWCEQLPPPGAGPGLQDAVEAGLLWLLEDHERLLQAETEAQRLGAVVSQLEQGVVTVDQFRGLASLNPAAARWLGLESGDQPVAAVAEAMVALERRALNPAEIAACGARLLMDPRGPGEAVVWRFPEAPTHLKVTSIPIRRSGFSGHIWVFDDLSLLLKAQEERERALQDQTEADQRFRLAMDNAAVGMALISRDGGFLEVNEALCRLFGTDADTLRGTTWQALTHPEDLHKGLALACEVLTGTRDHYRITKRYRRLDGQIIWGDVSVACLRDADGKFRSFIEQIVDITAVVNAREELRQQEQQFRLLAEHTSEIVLLYNPDLTLAWVSPSVQAVLGYDPAELIGRSNYLAIEPDRERLIATLRDAQQSRAKAFTLTLRIRAHDGTLHWCDLTVNLVWDPDGVLQRIISTLHNVDALIQARERYERTAELLQANADGMLNSQILIEAVRDGQGRIVDFVYRQVNRAGSPTSA